jgi:parallel beta-helix repeat protein
LTHERKHSRSKHRAGSSRGVSRPRSRLTVPLLVLVALALAAITAGAFVERAGVAPRLLGPYLERRASGHAQWMVALAATANRLLQHQDRGDLLPQPLLPDWAGARVQAASAAFHPGAIITPEQLIDALETVRPGTTITLAPGNYRFSGHSLKASRPGTEGAPITVRAAMLGTVRLEFDLLEGFHVTAPYWIFENLTVRGVCANHDNCEHAFHVAGGAHHVIIRNNAVSEFNAHIKINGADGQFPDNGRIVNNTLRNTQPRKTARPVTLIDMVAVNGWTIEGNLIADFVKDGGDYTSYGAFAKGGGAGNSFLRNVVLCEQRLRGAAGRRVGLSFGGGGSDAYLCRDRRCIVEHDDGLMAANLVASCSDEGIYINKSSRSQLIHNTVLDTAGINIRYPESAAVVAGNLVDGAIRAREGALLDADENTTTSLWALYLGWHPVRSLFNDADALDLRFVTPPPRTQTAQAGTDLCGQARPQPAAAGAFEDFTACTRPAAR